MALVVSIDLSTYKSKKDNDTMPRFFDPQSYPPTWQLIF